MSDKSEDRLSKLRRALKEQDFDGFVVPICDEHMSEYVGDFAQRLAWLTGFTGSAGSAIVLEEKAAVFVDGRYTTQAPEQVSEALYEIVQVPETLPSEWLRAAITRPKDGPKTIAYDPWLHPENWVTQMSAAVEKVGASLVPVEANPIDTLWADQPARAANPFYDHPIEYAGLDRESKLAAIAADVKDAGAHACVIASLDGLAWALNIRGSDIQHSPVGYGFLIVHADASADLAVQPGTIEGDLKEALCQHVSLYEYDSFQALLAEKSADGKTIMLDPATAVSALFQTVTDAGGTVLRQREPASLAKACKNIAEQDGTRAAHIRDGAALSRFLHWFDTQAPDGTVTEMIAADRLAAERTRTNTLKDLSFRTISAAGPHAALPHYSVTRDSNIDVPTNGLYLVDSGGQYLDGTTDVTRTIQVGDVSEEACQRYTLVLKGHIAVATQRFPAGTPGRAIDTLARMALWQAGLDYDHGTGHGVGSFLNVHEGPQRIAKAGSDEPLLAGMILSNEPGYYKPGRYGIRIENLVLVTEMALEGDERPMLGFETLTFAPIDTRPIQKSLLTREEVNWLNDYHSAVREKIAPLLENADLDWLNAATRAI